MYPDPKRVRNHRIAINLNDFEYAVIESLSNWLGIDKSRLVREMVMSQAKRLLHDDGTSQQQQNPLTKA